MAIKMERSVCTASVSSQTYAIKAQRALAEYAIESRVVRLDAAKSKKGCTYGIEFPCGHIGNVRKILSDVHVKARHFYDGDTEI